MQFVRFVRLLLLLALPLCSRAEERMVEHVTVIWASALRHPDGRLQLQLPPPSYKAKLAACGLAISSKPRSLFPVKPLLRCPGLLDFSAEAANKTAVESLLRNLLRNQVKRIGEVDVAEILAKMPALKIGVSPYGVFEAAVSPGSPEVARNAAINVASEKLVILNTPLWVYAAKEFRDLLLLHEVLGAAGFADEHYELTLRTWWLARHPDRIPDYQERLADSRDSGGILTDAGVSVVGHGGDFNQILLKASLLEAARRNLEIIGNDDQPVPKQFLPSKKEEEETIFTALIFSMGEEEMMEKGLCPGAGGRPDALRCGGFLLKGKTGAPFLLLSREWAIRSESQRWPLVLQLYTSLQTALVCTKGYPCRSQ